MDSELPYKILEILKELYDEDPTDAGIDYFEPALNLPEKIIQGTLSISNVKYEYLDWN